LKKTRKSKKRRKSESKKLRLPPRNKTKEQIKAPSSTAQKIQGAKTPPYHRKSREQKNSIFYKNQNQRTKKLRFLQEKKSENESSFLLKIPKSKPKK